jgi:protein-disulfide isomerase
MSRNFWIIVVVIVVVLVGIFTLTGKNGTTSSNLKPTEHIIGKGQSGVTLVEYGDYQCPYCGEYYSTIKQVQAIYNNQIYFQFRNFPLTSIHPNAYAGARAAEAAGLMGKFWQMHDLLYTQNQEYYNSNGAYATWIGASNPLSVFDQDAQSLGLNVAQFNKLYNSNRVNNLILADQNAGNALGIDATPTFIIDGKQVQIADSVSAFETVINAAIAAKTNSKVKVSSSGSTVQSKAQTSTH